VTTSHGFLKKILLLRSYNFMTWSSFRGQWPW